MLCVSLDLEVGKTDGRIHQYGAVQLTSEIDELGRDLRFDRGTLLPALQQLDQFAASASFLAGHNVILFDMPHLAAAKPDLKLLQRPALDTLWLNPLSFPRNPYHHLVKHYQDGQLKNGRLNDPVADARLTLAVLVDQFQALRLTNRAEPDLAMAWHWLTTRNPNEAAFDAFFRAVRLQAPPEDAQALAAISRFLIGKGCQTHGRAVLADAREGGWPLAYALAWLSVAGGNSVMPPWVRHQFPRAGQVIRLLRDTPCQEAGCPWCTQRHDAKRELARWFSDLTDFRQTPVDDQGRPLQQSIVEAAMRGEHVLAILPTGTGKSICYQIPALSRYDKTGALTVVISPLVALMADQVTGLEARGITASVAVNGLLSIPERTAALDRIRLGDTGIVIVSPEQLRSRALRKVLEQREIGAWVLDEAHCISKWGHDFRPDYRYVGRFIKEKAGNGPIPPILCLTATAKPDVIRDMVGHFADKVGVNLRLFNGGATRTNLAFEVVPTTPSEKLAHLHQVLTNELPDGKAGGAIVYCSTRKRTQEVSEFLQAKGLAAGHFHAGLAPESKKSTQASFINGQLRVIAATNAFGMGIDKPDVRLVIHADIPGSLENYLQEAGRAGRDRAEAKCVLMYTPEDVERQFGMSARSRLTQREINAILKSLRTLDRKKKAKGEVIATSGEILAEEEDGAFDRDSATDDTKVRTAISWLEEAVLLQRDENNVQVFPSSLRIGSIDEARKKLGGATLNDAYRMQLLLLVETLLQAKADEGISTDELMGAASLSPEMIRKAMHDLDQLGICSNDLALTAFVHVGVEDASIKRLETAGGLEQAIIEAMQLAAPELGKGESSAIHLRPLTQHLKDDRHPKVQPEHVRRIIRGLAEDGRGEEGGVGSLRLRSIDAETLQVTLQREWSALRATADTRRLAASCLVSCLLGKLPPGSRGKDLLAETTMGELMHAITTDINLKGRFREPNKLLQRALMWLHEQDVIRLNKGLAVFRPAMTIRLAQDRRNFNFNKADFAPLQLHYDEQVIQIHVMAEYVQRGLKEMAEALTLAMDYFRLEQEDFLKRWMPEREKELSRQTSPASWRYIVENLGNSTQQRIVADEREQTNVLILAGPGSGKTRVLVHRIAYLVRARREKPEGILALAYNRHAAVEIRRRLRDLIGDDARGVMVMTCHAMAMRLVGASFAGKMNSSQTDVFRQVLLDAVALLKGEGLEPEEADEQRDRLLSGFRWILVDEYQDIGPEQYDLISALAGRARKDEEGKLTLFAVGDDDQNIYAFGGASVQFIRRFEIDYSAKPVYLVENYRSTAHIIGASNAMIAPAGDRMKVDNPIEINRTRRKESLGGNWAQKDPLAQGRVQLLILPAQKDDFTAGQAVAVMREYERLSTLDANWRWDRCAVIATQWRHLDPIRAWCEIKGVPVQTGNEDSMNVWRLRETQALLAWIRCQPSRLLNMTELKSWVRQQAPTQWWQLLEEAVDVYCLEAANTELPDSHFTEWLAEWGREIRRRQSGLLLLSAHRSKGLEFDHVAILDGGWSRDDQNGDSDETRRLFYVAMTRARQTLMIAQEGPAHRFAHELHQTDSVVERQVAVAEVPGELRRRYVTPTLSDIDVGFAGRYASTHRVHADIAALMPGDLLQLHQEGQGWGLSDARSNVVARMSRAFNPPSGMRCVQARVLAIQTRTAAMTEEAYKRLVKTEEWEVVVPELVFSAT